MSKDFWRLVIKLAQLIIHFHETKNVREDKCIFFLKKSSEIYSTLTNYFKIKDFKRELEDYYFQYFYPNEYNRIVKSLHEENIDRKNYIDSFVENLRREMEREGIYAEIHGRPKHIYSIWRKMQKKSLDFDELFDVRAVRVVADCLQDCYGALCIIHGLYNQLPNEFDDYIIYPKPNGYQSIHTVVLGPKRKAVEIQIRTRKMHQNAELGIAAHWKYKGTESISDVEFLCVSENERYEFLQKLLHWRKEIFDSLKVFRTKSSCELEFYFGLNRDYLDLISFVFFIFLKIKS